MVHARAQLDSYAEWKVWTRPRFWTMGCENLKIMKIMEKWRLLAQNGAQKFKIALLMQNWRFAGSRKWLVETACLLENNILSGLNMLGGSRGGNYVSFSDGFFVSFNFTRLHLTGIFFYFNLVSYLGACKSSARSIGCVESLNPSTVLDHGGWKFQNHEICWKLKSPGSKCWPKIKNRFAGAKLTLRGEPEVTHRDGLPLGG